MSFYAFRLLSPDGQLYRLLQHSTFLADRREQEDDSLAQLILNVP